MKNFQQYCCHLHEWKESILFCSILKVIIKPEFLVEVEVDKVV
jgi:hypothetical protein